MLIYFYATYNNYLAVCFANIFKIINLKKIRITILPERKRLSTSKNINDTGWWHHSRPSRRQAETLGRKHHDVTLRHTLGPLPVFVARC